MAGIVGIEAGGKQKEVRRMLKKIAHRGRGGELIVDHPNATLGVVMSVMGLTGASKPPISGDGEALDSENGKAPEEIKREWRPFALAYSTDNGVLLARSRVGVRPLYYGKTVDGTVAFASEVKALMEVTQDIREFPPGAIYRSGDGIEQFTSIQPRPVRQMTPEAAALELRQTLELAISRRVDQEVMGSWLSGGLDSSVIAALVRPRVKQLLTFTGGLPGAPDLASAREVAAHVGSKHHEVVVRPHDLPAVLPEVIYALESFDALLVRSTVINYLVGKAVAQHVSSVFSGEGGDELFAGYDYLKDLPGAQLQAELVDITNRLHNTALQRVDRSASSHGVVPHVPFLDPQVLDLALEIPSDLKLRPGNPPIEKWVLRKCIEDVLPGSIVWRRKAKFWEGAGVQEVLSEHAEHTVGDADFLAGRSLPNGWVLNSKEEFLYYRIFKERYGELETLDWMGRTKGVKPQP